jgi:hypothetical protein
MNINIFSDSIIELIFRKSETVDAILDYVLI